MSKDNVVDYFSRRPMRRVATPDDPANNAKVAESIGKYVGVIPKHEAKVIRDMVEQMRRKRGQIEALMDEFAKMHDGFGYMLLGAIVLLGINDDQFNPETHDLYVDKEGHCWMVSMTERERMEKSER